MHHPTSVEHWLEQEIAQWVYPVKDRSNDPPHHDRTLYINDLNHMTDDGYKDRETHWLVGWLGGFISWLVGWLVH